MNSAVKSIMDKIEAPSLIAELNDAWQKRAKKNELTSENGLMIA